MMKKKFVGIIVVITMLMGVVSQTAWAKAVHDGTGKIEISGKGNTLASVAKDIGDTKLFSYDPVKRAATCQALNVSIIKGGELTIGVKDQKDKAETLIFECEITPGLTKGNMKQDKDKYSFNVNQGGSLNIYHSKIEAVNGLINAGTARHKGVSYYRSSGEIVDSTFRNMKWLSIRACDHKEDSHIKIDGLVTENCVMGVYLHTVSGSIKGLETRNVQKAAYIRARTGKKIKFTSCSLIGKREVILCSRIDRDTEPILIDFIDCEFPKEPGKRISITSSNVGIAVLHNVKVTLLDENKSPMSGIQLRLTSESKSTPGFDPATVVTDGTGSTWLTVPEYVNYNSDAASSKTGQHSMYTSRLTASDGKVLKDNWTPAERIALVFTRAGDSFSESKGKYTEGKSLSINNLIVNSSFEYTSYPDLPDCWWPRHWIQFTEDFMGKYRGPDAPLSFWGLDRKNPYHGKQCLKIGGKNRGMTWKWFPIYNKGGTNTISAYMRSDVPGTKAGFAFRFGGVKQQIFELTSEWKRYHFTASFDRDVVFRLKNLGPGDAYIDAVQIEEGSELHPYVQDNYKPFAY